MKSNLGFVTCDKKAIVELCNNAISRIQKHRSERIERVILAYMKKRKYFFRFWKKDLLNREEAIAAYRRDDYEYPDEYAIDAERDFRLILMLCKEYPGDSIVLNIKDYLSLSSWGAVPTSETEKNGDK